MHALRKQANTEPAMVDGRPGDSRTHFEGLLACAVLLALILSSLTPFSFNFDATETPGGVGWLGWPPSNAADVVTNVLVYVPVGVSFMLLLRRRLTGLAALILAVIMGAGLSWAIETAQTVIATRYASWVDVIFNSTGAALGAAAAWVVAPALARLPQAMRHGIRRRPMSTLATLAVYGVMAYTLVPFDFVTSAEGLQSSFRRAQLPLLATVYAGRLIPQGPAPAAATFGGATEQDLFLAGVFAMVGFLVALARCEQRGYSPGVVMAAVSSGWILAVVVETLQLFSASHTFDLFDLLMNGAGATLGGGAVLVFRLTSHGRGAMLSNTRVPTFAVAFFWLFQVALSVGAAYTRFSGQTLDLRVSWAPFADYFYRPFAPALASIVEVFASYVLLTMTTAVLTRRLLEARRGTPGLAMLAVAVVAGAVLTAGLGASHGTGKLSVSDLILALIAAVLTLRVHQFFIVDRPSAGAAQSAVC